MNELFTYSINTTSQVARMYSLQRRFFSSLIDLTLAFNYIYLTASFLFLLSQLIQLPCPYSLVYVFRLCVIVYVSLLSL